MTSRATAPSKGCQGLAAPSLYGNRWPPCSLRQELWKPGPQHLSPPFPGAQSPLCVCGGWLHKTLRAALVCAGQYTPAMHSPLAFFKKICILLIMLLQLSHFPSLYSSLPSTPLPPAFSPLTSCPWVMHRSSLASPFPLLFLTSPCLFSTYHLCYLFSIPFPLSPPSTALFLILHVISISVILFLF